MSIALVTGASRGLGLATARALAKSGSSVILTGRDNPRTQAAAALRDEGLDVQAPCLEVEDPSSIAAAATYVERRHGRLDILVNNAGVLDCSFEVASITRMSGSDAVVDWLLGSDPSIRWQVMRDLQDRPESQWRQERARVETEGWGARLLALEDPDGQWDGGAFLPRDFQRSEWEEVGQPWTATSFVLSQLRELGLDPASDSAVRAVRLIGENSFWWGDDGPFWGGETEECINGRVVADGAYFGVDVSPLVARLVGERLEDGGWNCERPNGSARSSFATTINVLEGLLEHERATGGTPDSRAARRAGEEYLLQRGLFRRLSTGEPADEEFLCFLHPSRWRYDVLRALDYFRAAADLDDGGPDPRMGEAIDHLRTKQTADGRWVLERTPGGRVWFDIDDGVGQPSRWLTLRAPRVLRWWDG